MQLMIDSEGILGVITRVTFRLYPKFAGTATLIVSYDDRHAAINTVPKILQSGVIPLAVEYIERDAVDVSTAYLGLKWPAEKGNAYLMIIATGVNEDDVYAQCEKISEICQGYGALDVLIAERREEQADILKIRSEMYSALKSRVSDIMDAAVPPAEMANLMDTIDKIAEEYHTHIITFGHAGDGNLHSHILRDVYERGQLHEVKEKIYREAVALGGVVTAEHGIGKIRLSNLSLCVDEKSLEIMKAIKKVFDPNNILNPGTAI